MADPMKSLIDDIPAGSETFRSDVRKIPLWARTFPSLAFYGRFIPIVFRAASQAKHNRYQTVEWFDSSLDVFQALEKAGVSMEVSGLHHLQTLQSPCVIIGNHMSVMETVVLPRMILPHRNITFVVKESLLNYPVFKHVMRSRDPITVGRSNPREDLKAVLNGGVERLQKGISIIVFPQTTRTYHLDPEQFNSIGVKLAAKAKVPVLPVALRTDAWGQSKLLKDFGKIDPRKVARFAFGAPLEIQGRGSEEHQRIIDFITEHLRGWEKS